MHSGLRRVWAVIVLATLAGCASEPGGPGDGGHPGAHPASAGESSEMVTLRCESDHGHKRRCDVDTRGGVVLSRRMSTTPCIQGLNWDFDERGIWVTAGCRAEFTTGGGHVSGAAVHPDAKLVRCESDKGRRRRCDVAVTQGVDLRRNISRTPCIRGDNWGWDRGGVWVDHGCRGDFEVF